MFSCEATLLLTFSTLFAFEDDYGTTNNVIRNFEYVKEDIELPIGIDKFDR